MSAPALQPTPFQALIDALTFLPDRRPDGEHRDGWAAKLADYRDGGVFAVHYAGQSAWERHGQGDELVFVLAGETVLTLATAAGETAHTLRAGELLVVPQGVWHRFDTADGVKVMTVTPQPTDHDPAIERPPVG